MDTLQDRIDKGQSDIETAEKEVRRLQGELMDGTLDRKKLQTGLQKLEETLCKLGAHLPTFSK